MNARLAIWMGIAVIGLVVGFVLLNDIQRSRLDMRFFQLGKYYWAGEESMLRMLEKSNP